MYIYPPFYLCLYACIYVRMYVHVCTYEYMYYVCMNECLFVCMNAEGWAFGCIYETVRSKFRFREEKGLTLIQC